MVTLVPGGSTRQHARQPTKADGTTVLGLLSRRPCPSGDKTRVDLSVHSCEIVWLEAMSSTSGFMILETTSGRR